MKIVKYLLITVVALIVLFIGAAGIFVATFDPMRINNKLLRRQKKQPDVI